MTPTAPKAALDAVGDTRVELILELIAELSDERRERLARRLTEIDGRN